MSVTTAAASTVLVRALSPSPDSGIFSSDCCKLSNTVCMMGILNSDCFITRSECCSIFCFYTEYALKWSKISFLGICELMANIYCLRKVWFQLQSNTWWTQDKVIFLRHKVGYINMSINRRTGIETPWQINEYMIVS